MDLESSTDAADIAQVANNIKVEVNKEEERSSCLQSLPITLSVSETQARLDALKTRLHDKGSQLSCAWNDLYALLGQYQAELFSKEGELLASRGKYEDVTDLNQLRDDLVRKDEEIRQYEQRLSKSDSQFESVQLDLSVKNSLLKKYQQELLDKEAILLTSQSNIKKLENRVRVLESKLAMRIPDSMSMAEMARQSHSLSDRSISSGLLNTRISPATFHNKRRSLLPSGSMLQGSQKRKLSAPAQSKPTIVCIEDDDDIKEISTGLTEVPSTNSDHHRILGNPSTSSASAALIMDVWCEQQQHGEPGNGANQTMETDATQIHSLPGTGESIATTVGHDMNIHQPFPIVSSLTAAGISATSQSGALPTFQVTGPANISGIVELDDSDIQGWEVQMQQPVDVSPHLALSTSHMLAGDMEKLPQTALRGLVESVELPPFNPALRRALETGRAFQVWSDLIHVSALFYLDKFGLGQGAVTNSLVFDQIGTSMYIAYPSISSNGTPPWKQFKVSLSARIRKLRYFRRHRQFPKYCHRMLWNT